MNGYLIPANSNRGKLIFGFFRPVDLIVFGTGIFATFILLLIFRILFYKVWYSKVYCGIIGIV